MLRRKESRYRREKRKRKRGTTVPNLLRGYLRYLVPPTSRLLGDKING